MDPQLKQRLIGATVLIALAIIFVPMLLSGPAPKDGATVSLEIPPPPEREFQTRVVPADGGKASVPTPVAPVATPVEPDKVATVEADKNPRVEVPQESQPKPASTPTAKPAEVATAKPAAPKSTDAKPPEPKATEAKSATGSEAKPNAAAEGRFLVHLGVFANAANAGNLVASAKKLGLPSVSEATDVDGKSATRVRLGPFPSRAAAEAARLKFKEAEPKVAGSVIETTPAEPKADAPATALAASHAGSWAVQLGAFKQQDEANKLRDRVKNAGFAVFVEPVGQGAERLWRVRVGPEADRSNAEKTRDAIKAKLALNGTVVTQS